MDTLHYLGIFVYLLGPIILSIAGPRFFLNMRYVRKLRPMASTFDGASIGPIEAPLPLKNLRNTDGLGDKTVVSHHLSQVAEEVADDMGPGFQITAVGVLILLIFSAFTVSKNATEAVTMSDFLDQLMRTVATSYLAPAGVVFVLLYFLISAAQVRKQARRCRSVLGD